VRASNTFLWRKKTAGTLQTHNSVTLLRLQFLCFNIDAHSTVNLSVYSSACCHTQCNVTEVRPQSPSTLLSHFPPVMPEKKRCPWMFLNVRTFTTMQCRNSNEDHCLIFFCWNFHKLKYMPYNILLEKISVKEANEWVIDKRKIVIFLDWWAHVLVAEFEVLLLTFTIHNINHFTYQACLSLYLFWLFPRSYALVWQP
jgi:hypothetical protein